MTDGGAAKRSGEPREQAEPAARRAWWRRVEGLVALALLAAVAAPFWAGRFLPLLDLPQHLGLASVLLRYRDATARFSTFYDIRAALDPYWGYYAAMRLLGLAFPVETANRLLFTAYAVLVPAGAAYVLRALGRDRRWAVFALPLVFNTNLYWGFATFLLSIPVFLFALGLSIRHLGEGLDRRRELALAAAAALLFLFHGQTYLLLGPCVILLLVMGWRGAAWAARKSLTYLPSLLLFGSWFWRDFVALHPAEVTGHTPEWRSYGSIQGASLGAGLGIRFDPLAEVVTSLPDRLMGAFRDRSEQVILWSAALLFLAALALCRGGAARDGAGAPVGWRDRALRWRGELLALLLFCSYLFGPAQVSGQFYLNQRHLIFAALLAPVLLRAPATGLRRWVLGLAAALSLGASANAAAKVIAFQGQVGPFAELVESMEPGGRALGLVFDTGAGGPIRFWPFLHFACYYQALRGGDVGFSFAGLPSIPVVYRPGQQAPHPYEWRPEDFRWETMGRFYDYFLVRGSPRGDAARLADHAVLVKTAGEWRLWHNPGAITRTDAQPSSSLSPAGLSP